MELLRARIAFLSLEDIRDAAQAVARALAAGDGRRGHLSHVDEDNLRQVAAWQTLLVTWPRPCQAGALETPAAHVTQQAAAGVLSLSQSGKQQNNTKASVRVARQSNFWRRTSS